MTGQRYIVYVGPVTTASLARSFDDYGHAMEWYLYLSRQSDSPGNGYTGRTIQMRREGKVWHRHVAGQVQSACC